LARSEAALGLAQIRFQLGAPAWIVVLLEQFEPRDSPARA
jgi:hypothetical protein